MSSSLSCMTQMKFIAHAGPLKRPDPSPEGVATTTLHVRVGADAFGLGLEEAWLGQVFGNPNI